MAGKKRVKQQKKIRASESSKLMCKLCNGKNGDTLKFKWWKKIVFPFHQRRA